MTPFADGALLRAAAGANVVPLSTLAAGGILVLVPHPDDETLGCGAALAVAVDLGHDVHVAVVTDGGGSHPRSKQWPPVRLAERRADELAAALAVLGRGAITHECLDYPDQCTPAPGDPGVAEVLARLARTMHDRGLGTIWTTWEGDPHVDHVRCAALAAALAETFAPAADVAANVLRFPVWGRFVDEASATAGEELVRFVPDAAARGLKRRALACHASQMSPLVDDDPTGFVMPEVMQRHFIEHDELFLSSRAR